MPLNCDIDFASNPVPGSEPWDIENLTAEQIAILEAGVSCGPLSPSALNTVIRLLQACNSVDTISTVTSLSFNANTRVLTLTQQNGGTQTATIPSVSNDFTTAVAIIEGYTRTLSGSAQAGTGTAINPSSNLNGVFQAVAGGVRVLRDGVYTMTGQFALRSSTDTIIKVYVYVNGNRSFPTGGVAYPNNHSQHPGSNNGNEIIIGSRCQLLNAGDEVRFGGSTGTSVSVGIGEGFVVYEGSI